MYTSDGLLVFPVRAHAFFEGVDWQALADQKLSPLMLTPPLDTPQLLARLTA